jgi:PEP-CTERM motif
MRRSIRRSPTYPPRSAARPVAAYRDPVRDALPLSAVLTLHGSVASGRVLTDGPVYTFSEWHGWCWRVEDSIRRIGGPMSHPIKLVLSFVAFSFSSLAVAVPVTFSVGGDDTAASIQATVDSFRAALGSPNNGIAPGPLAGGRREINWDGGGGVDATTVSATPFNGFLNTRGAQFTTPGTGFAQAPPSGGSTNGLAGLFGNLTYGAIFSTFSPLRLFVPVDSNVTDGIFSLPGSNGAVPATVSGFGAVFTDVDLADTTRIDYFDAEGDLLHSAAVPTGTDADGSLSFVGVIFDAGERIARVRITTGNAALGPNDGNGIDVVGMDDFLYGEPRAVPEPSALALLGLALAGLGFARRRNLH